jgi:hypothetical protein
VPCSSAIVPSAAPAAKPRIYSVRLRPEHRCGWVQREGGPVEEMGPGDTVWIAPVGKHWHGVTPAEGMTHIAISERLDGTTVEWLEHVSDADYRRGPGPDNSP